MDGAPPTFQNSVSGSLVYACTLDFDVGPTSSTSSSSYGHNNSTIIKI